MTIVVRPSAGRHSNPAKLEDDFTSDHFLNQSIWSTYGEVLDARVLKADTKFVPVRLAFSNLGMTMRGVDDPYQSTAIQSVRSFSPPLTLETKVMGTTGSGSPSLSTLSKRTVAST